MDNYKLDSIIRDCSSLHNAAVHLLDRIYSFSAAIDTEGFKGKRGYLLTGASGTGKSTLVRQVLKSASKISFTYIKSSEVMQSG